MIEVGLQPSDTGAPGGKATGQHMTHYVIDGGRFALAFHKLAGEGFQLRWQSRAEDETARKKKASSKTKYTCTGCGANAWAKPDTSLICGDCYDDGDGEISIMMPEGEAGGVT